MLFDKELKRLQIEKNRVALRCELRRRLAPIEIRSIRAGTRRPLRMMTSGIVISRIILELLQELRYFRKKR